jgi:hypothetical protein
MLVLQMPKKRVGVKGLEVGFEESDRRNEDERAVGNSDSEAERYAQTYHIQKL